MAEETKRSQAKPASRDEPKADEDKFATAAEAPLGPNFAPAEITAEAVKSTDGKRQIPVTPEEQAKAGVSAADLELTTAAGGPEIRVKSNPEIFSAQQVASATSTQTGPAQVTVTITDEDGEQTETEVRPDDIALIQQRSAPPARAFRQAGHGGNPLLRDLTDEEKEENEKATAARHAKA
jgi:hypothetical protein